MGIAIVIAIVIDIVIDVISMYLADLTLLLLLNDYFVPGSGDYIG